MNICCPDSADVFSNLALEDLLLDRGDTLAPLLMLHVNGPCVVIGKNQVPWRECATGLLRQDGVPLARRISGGGTVWHDEGNLNYAFILPRASYRQEEVFAIILRALAALDITARVGPNNGLFVGDRKFSGTAFCYRRQHVLHHGTLLVRAGLDRLRRYCTPALPHLVTRAIASKPAPVMNLCEARADLDVETLADAILGEADSARIIRLDPALVAERAAALSAWDFLWGHTPAFEIESGGRTLRVERGIVTGPDLTPLRGVRFERDTLRPDRFPALAEEDVRLLRSLAASAF